MDNPRLNLTVKSGPAARTSCVLPYNQPITFGRGNENYCVLSEDSGISKKHFEIHFYDGKCWIKDLNSRNGVYVNSHPVLSGQIKVGDEIRAGKTLLVVEVNSDEPESLLPRQYIGPKINLLVGDETTIVAPRRILSAKLGRDQIQSDAFLEHFHDSPQQAILVFGKQEQAPKDLEADFVTIIENCKIWYPSGLDAFKLLVENTNSNSIMLLNFTVSRTRLQEHISDHIQAFASPEQFLTSYHELPAELSNALLDGIDLIVCDWQESRKVEVLFAKHHTMWLSQLIKNDNVAQPDIN